jgi:4-hydroxybenzoate polyprenyltransferase
MAEQKRQPTEKNPVGAAILSAIFPGMGFFYIGSMVKGVAYMLIFAALIVLEIEGRGSNHVVFALMIAGFYIFQVFDSHNEARRINSGEIPKAVGEEKISLFASFVILGLGIFFQLAELRVIRYRDIANLWPLILIVLGAKFIYTYAVTNREEKQGNNDPLEQETGGQNE